MGIGSSNLEDNYNKDASKCPSLVSSTSSSSSSVEAPRTSYTAGKSTSHGASCSAVQITRTSIEDSNYNDLEDVRVVRRKRKIKAANGREMTSAATMEPSMTQTIAQLAGANHQLAAAHSLVLEHCRDLMSEIKDGYEKRVKSGNFVCLNCQGREKNPGPRIIVTTKARRLGFSNSANKRLRKLKKNSTASSIEKTEDVKSVNENTSAAAVMLESETNLRREIEQLNEFKLESQKINEKLTHDMEQQRLLIERLTRDFRDSQRECASKEKSLELAREKLSRSELEGAKLLARLETFQCERREEEAEERRKHLQALEEVTQQIRALESAISNSSSSSSNNKAQRSSKSSPSSSTTSEEQESFKRDLLLKREARQRAIAAISSEMERLRNELESEKLAHSETTRLLQESLREEVEDEEASKAASRLSEEHVEALRLLDLLKVSDEVSLSLRLQLERMDDLRFQLESDPEEHQQRIGSLRRLAEEARASLRARKQQTAGLKDRLSQLLARLSEDRRLQLLAGNLDDDIRREAERQLQDIARSRQLSDERSRVLAELKDELRLKLASLSQDNQNLEEELRKTEGKIDAQDSDILNLESQLGLAKADCRDLQNQVSLINSLFSQMLLGASSAEMDLDRLTQLLQENHDLITGMAKEKGTEAAALPKLLLDLIEQVDGRGREAACLDERKEESELREESIAHNLPKVWRILLELLSCQASGTSTNGSASSCANDEATGAASLESSPDSCYKSVDTPTGPRLVISVSKTYIRLKELILEKKHLEKEMNRMKQLNNHLETKLSEQEKRLSTVSDELSKTWNVVGRMQAQHQQLHTHEKILRYELQQKRKMLQELKQELEYCREKWESARQKNTNTEMEWKSLRREFAARKALVSHASAFSNSGESGFSDDREEESDEEDRDIGKRVRPLASSRRRSKKDGARVMSPDTESENQATDTEFSESKVTSPSVTSGQQTPAPETEEAIPELSQEVVQEEASVEAVATSPSPPLPNSEETPEVESLNNSLDKALAKVIENLIETDECKSIEPSSSSSSSSSSSAAAAGVSNSESGAKPKQQTLGESAKPRDRPNKEIIVSGSSDRAVNSVFSIGPTPKATKETDGSRITQFGQLLPLPTPAPSADGPSTSAVEEQKTNPIDARAARLKSLEEQAQWLVKKVNDTNRRGSALNSRLEELHEAYGSIPVAPPMPDVLPAFRLRSELKNVEDNAVTNDGAEALVESEQRTNDDH